MKRVFIILLFTISIISTGLESTSATQITNYPKDVIKIDKVLDGTVQIGQPAIAKILLSSKATIKNVEMVTDLGYGKLKSRETRIIKEIGVIFGSFRLKEIMPFSSIYKDIKGGNHNALLFILFSK